MVSVAPSVLSAPSGSGELRVPVGADVSPVAVRLALRSPAPAERRRLRFGGEMAPLLEIPTFVVGVGHDELLAERRPPVD